MSFIAPVLGGVLFVVVGELCVRHEVTRSTGVIFQLRVTESAQNWQRHTARSLFETSFWIGAIYGIYAYCHSLVLALQLGTAAAMLLILCGEWYNCRKSGRTVTTSEEKPVRTALQYAAGNNGIGPKALPFMCGGAFVGGSLFLSMYQSHTLLAALPLTVLAGAVFVFAAEILLIWPPSREAGLILQQRVTRTLENWQKHTLRSFMEVVVWFFVTYGTWRRYHSLITALKWGTWSGIGMALLGEYLFRCIRIGELFKDDFTGTMLPFLVLFGCILGNCLHFIYEHEPQVFAACVMATLAGIVFLLAGELMVIWEPTRAAGRTLVNRVTQTRENWEKHTLRSFIEVVFWQGVTLGSFSLYGDVCFALQWGTLSAWIIVLCGDFVMKRISPAAYTESSPVESDARFLVHALPLVSSVYLGYNSVQLLQWIYLHIQDFGPAFLLATLAGFGFMVAAESIHFLNRTSIVGKVLTNRVNRLFANWRNYTLRSFIETTVWLSSLFGSSKGLGLSVPVAINISVAAGVAVVLASEYVTNAFQRKPLREPRVVPQKVPSGATGPVFTAADVLKHAKKEDAWIAVHGSVYDITDWIPRHPGGEVLLPLLGHDCSDQFEAFHRPYVRKYLGSMRIGSFVDEREIGPVDKEYRELRQQLWEQGAFESDKKYYVLKFCIVAVLFTASIILLHCARSFWMQSVLSGALMALAWQQSAFIAHDAAHNGVVHPSKFNWVAWFHGSVIFGVSMQKWQYDHTVHHAITLRPLSDPQFMYLPIWLQNWKELEYYKINRLAKILISFQHISFPILCLGIGRVNFLLINLVHAIVERIYLDVVAMAVYWCYNVYLLSVLPDTTSRCVWFTVSAILAGILHVQLLLSHLATEVFHEHEEHALGFFTFQLRTSRNITCSRLMNWFHGGLEYQIEHHLFPQLPRHNLSKVKPRVLAICAKYGVPYKTEPFWDACRICLGDFRKNAYLMWNLNL
eukprot:TRINITY_DN53666_c0_g1_i1.p1 TRINITY_DN53666_c0_g1~~TRINITY_DN53666_c0_g1_i1.p1  ORF type:complete len:977 (+),score=132.51 TRINITY_DN53666_c0_g1_i1:24-2933(+)